MKRFACATCGSEVYFENTFCGHTSAEGSPCGRLLGFAPETATMLSSADGTTFAAADGTAMKPCGNRAVAGCNWVLPADSADTWCAACVHNRTIPNQSDEVAVERWAKLEAAKRHLFYSLIRWNLPHPRKVADDDDGLAFDFLTDLVNPDGTVVRVLTGHSNGLITINVAEGDDAERERRRTELGEPYRTLVGHFRHEVGHYYWDRLVKDAGPEVLARFRNLFGDDTLDYNAALQAHYQRQQEAHGFDWREAYVSTYATAHAWEDFAETWAHYLHMVDALETSGAFGLRTVGYVDRSTHAVDFDPYVAGSMKDIVEAWVPVTIALNAINRSMGQRDFYPFEGSEKPLVQEKLAFVHDIIRARARREPSQIAPTQMPEAEIAPAAEAVGGAPGAGVGQPAAARPAARLDAKAPPNAAAPARKSWWRFG